MKQVSKVVHSRAPSAILPGGPAESTEAGSDGGEVAGSAGALGLAPGLWPEIWLAWSQNYGWW